MPHAVTDETIEEGIIDALATMGPERDEITRDATFAELDIDSLDLVELLQIAEERWGVQVDPEATVDISTVGAAIDLILARFHAAAGPST